MSHKKVSLHRYTKAEVIRRATTHCKHGHTLLAHPQCDVTKPPRVGYLDIEASNLVADFGIILSWCILDEDSGKIIEDTIKAADISTASAGDEDKRVVSTLIKAMLEFDVIVTFYGKRYDAPFIRTRAVAMGLDFPLFGTLKHVDVYDMVRHRFRLSSNRLENACRVLLGTTNKTRIENKFWRGAARGHAPSIKQVLIHNRYDVIDLQKLYNKVKEFSRKHEVSL